MFKVFKLRLYYHQTTRALAIVHILIRHWRVNWMSKSKFFRGFVSKRYKSGGIVHTQEERIRMILEELGPTFVKFGQILADRPDMVSEKLRLELKKLQANVNPFNNKTALQLIENELGGPIEKFFQSIEPECIAAASIGQVYKGVLKDGSDVIVKVQRPGIEPKIQLDLYLMKFIAKEAVKEYPGLAVVNIVGFVDEFGVTIKQEMDYLVEASNGFRFAEMFREIPYCKIPAIYMDISTKKILVMEFVDGFKPAQMTEMKAAGLDPKIIAENGTHILLKMILQHGFFQADPHPGNFFIQENNRLALVDFGMVGILKPAHMNFLANFTIGMASLNAKIVTSALLTLCEKKYYHDRDDLEFAIQDMLNRFGYLPYEKMDFSLVLNECIQIMLKHQLQLPKSIYLLLKALAIIEKFGYNLDPDISLPALIKPYAHELVKQKISVKAIATDLYDTIKDYADLIRDFPGEINQILYRIKEGKIMHDIQIKDSSALSKSAMSFGRIVSLAMIIGFMLAGSIVMTIWGKPEWMGNLMFATTSVFSIWILLRLMLKTKF
jgi:ubiquinone biosynthesis protein